MIVNLWRFASGGFIQTAPTDLAGICPLNSPETVIWFRPPQRTNEGAIMTLTKENLIQTLYDQIRVLKAPVESPGRNGF